MPAVMEIASSYGWNSTLAEVSEGDLALHLDITADSTRAPRLTGWAQISDAVLQPRGVSNPLRIAGARVQFQRNQLKISSLAAELGPLALTGSATVQLPARPPAGAASGTVIPSVEFALHSAQVELAELAAVFVSPPETDYFFGFRRPDSPELTRLDASLISFWSALQARGVVRMDAARYGGLALEQVEASVSLHDRQLEIPEFSAEQAGGRSSGSAAIYFAQVPLNLTLDAHFTDLRLESLAELSQQWNGAISGNLSGVLHLAGSGRTVEEIVSQLHGLGQASGSEILFHNAPWAEVLGLAGAAETRIASFASDFQIGKRMIRIAEMEVIPTRRAQLGDDPQRLPARWWIRGDVGFDQALDLMVQRDPDGSTLQWAGTLAEPQLSRSIANGATANALTTTRGSDASLAPE